MKKKSFLLYVELMLQGFVALAFAQQTPDSIFASYFRSAQTFADTYPREKAYLHFDNTSYYRGDTIWFKAYVATAEGNRRSSISRPLYVELLDQLGNLIERQIVKLEQGEGHGQIILKTSYLTGYYEVRAYTRWMQAFDAKPYFSRTFPVYQSKWLNGNMERSISTYYLDKTMKQRPSTIKEKFILRFFPEGGGLVRGLASIVAFEAESRDQGPVSVTGVIRTKDNRILTDISTLHEGMGYFAYTPELEPAIAEVEYEGKMYCFTLPEASSSGYVMYATNKNGVLDVRVMKNLETSQDTLALFISCQGRPYTYGVFDFAGGPIQHFYVPTTRLSGGVVQLSLISTRGATLCERLCYVMPERTCRIETDLTDRTYKPYEPVCFHLSVRDKDNHPVRTRLSVSVCDALNSDCLEYDNSIYTDLLLTSDLKGYIHQPGYYFADSCSQRLKALDLLMLVRGWRKYDMEQAIGTCSFNPSCFPERELVLRGQVRSYARLKARGNMVVSVLVQRDSFSIAGSSLADSLGHFSIPLEFLEGTMDALIQTSQVGRKHNKMTAICLSRNFSPPLRRYGYPELHPSYVDMDSLRLLSALSDSLYEDSIKGDAHRLNEVLVKGSRRKRHRIVEFEQSISAYYDVPVLLDEMRDEGMYISKLYDLLPRLNKDMVVEEYLNEGEYSTITCKNKSLLYFVDGKLMSDGEVYLFLGDDVDAIKYIILCEGRGALNAGEMNTIRNNPVDFGILGEIDHFDYIVNGYSRESLLAGVICYITTVDGWRPERNSGGSWGIRRTRIQGYSRPLEFYSPNYGESKLFPPDDHRRTLYWNPDVETDEHGNVELKCYNAGNSTYLTIRAESLYNGEPITLTK